MPKNNNLSGGLFAAKPTALTIKETPLSAQIKNWLDNRRIYNDRIQCGQFQTPSGHWMRGSKRGTPDRFAVVLGQIIFIEVKMFGEKPTAEQLKRHDELRESGAIVIVTDYFRQFTDEFSAVCAVLIRAQNKETKLYD